MTAVTLLRPSRSVAILGSLLVLLGQGAPALGTPQVDADTPQTVLPAAVPPLVSPTHPRRGVPTFTWSHNLSQRWLPRGLRDGYTRAGWLAEVSAMLEESGRAGLDFSGYYALPWRIPERYVAEPTAWRKPSELARRYKSSRLTWDVAAEAGTYWAAARSGAMDFDPRSRSIEARVSPLDPVYEAVAAKELATAARAVRGRPYVAIYQGLDEPYFPLPRVSRSRWSAWLKAADARIRAEYGYGRLGMPEPTSRAFARDPERHLRWIAFNRWASDAYLAQRLRLKTHLRSIDAEAVYAPSDLKFVDGIPAIDFSRWAQVADVVEGDPYFSRAERAAPGRGRHNHGFGAKFLSDLTRRPVRIIVQAFDYARYSPTRSDLVEWTSQALIGGADLVSYYELDNPRFSRPDRYAALLGLARALRTVRTSKEAPASDDITVLWSLTSGATRAGWSVGDPTYAAYVMLGPGSGARFRFISDTQVERGEIDLRRSKVIFVPEARYLPRTVAAALSAWVDAGGTLVVGDPWAFDTDRAGASLADIRSHLLGDGPGAKTASRRVRLASRSILASTHLAPSGETSSGARLSAESLVRALAGKTLPITTVRRESGSAYYRCRKLTVRRDETTTVVLARYPGGGPAAIERSVGLGRVVYFAASPFASGSAASPGWRAFTRWLIRRAELPTGDAAWHWRLKLPAPRTVSLKQARPPTLEPSAAATITARARGLASLRWKVTGSRSARACVVGTVRLGRGRVARLLFSWARTGRWVRGTAPVRLRRGTYRITLSAVDLSGAQTRRGVRSVLVVR